MTVLPVEVVKAAARGWRIHPLQPHSKVAILKRWQLKATSNPGQIEAWARQHPGCNWAAVAGPESGFFAVDVDDPATMQKLEDEHDPLPEGLCIVTSRGYTLIYEWPKDKEVCPATKHPCEGIDIRGRGSYIAIPPSIHPSGHLYRYSDDSLAIPVCPPWLLALILSQRQRGAQDQQCVPAVGTVASAPVGKGWRTKYLVSLAGTMSKRGMTPEAIEAALIAENAAKCSPQLPGAKVRAIARDITARYPNLQFKSEGKPTVKPDLVCLAEVDARHVDWLWEPFIPLRMLSMISGDPGAGKSFVALSVAAELSRGKLLDGRIGESASTLYLTVENPTAEVMRPRFDSLGGDPNRLYLLQGRVSLADVDELEAAVVRTQSRLVIVDPLQSFLGANVDLHRSNETRPVLDGLARLAEKHGLAIVLLRHLSKQGGGKPIHRGLGSIDLTGAARSEMLAGSLADDPEARALVHIKSNVGRIGNTRGYLIDGQGRFTWTGESSITAADLLTAPVMPGDHKLAEASQWLATQLKPGSREQKQIQELAESAGISYATLRRAKRAILVQVRKAGMSGPWMWSLPEDAHVSAEDAQGNL